MRNIIVRYSSVDRFSETKRFATLGGAQRYAQRMLGKHPTQGTHYAVSDDGIGKIEVEGTSLRELFPHST